MAEGKENGHFKMIIGFAGSLVAMGIWVGTMQSVQMQHEDELKSIWSKYNAKLEEEKKWELEVTLMGAHLAQHKVEIDILKKEIEELHDTHH